MDERDASDLPTPCRVTVQHLTVEQVALLRSVLRAGEVPFGIVRGELIAPREFADDVEKAVEWASLDTHAIADAEFDDPEYRSDRPPLVKPPRPPLADGRHQATRWRRLCAGLFDWVAIGLPALFAHQAGVGPWAIAVGLALYFVVPTAVWGCSLGKRLAGLRVVSSRRLVTPNPLSVTIRWLVTAAPILVGLFVDINGDLVGFAVTLVYAPILVGLRGLHDLVAGTIVVEVLPSGPGVWVRDGESRHTA
jgi:uncharacterized RDD family membrane protein YckC